MNIKNNKLVLFGAGKIGRSFIGQLFGTGGYEVVFIDVYRPVIDELNRRKSYRVIFVTDDKNETVTVRNVRGVYAGDVQQVVQEVATAGIVAVSVGANGLGNIFPLLAEGLMERYRTDNTYALDIIIAENIRNADAYFRTSLKKLLPGFYPFDELTGLIETSIGKMVPFVPKDDAGKDILQIVAEPYNALILSKDNFKNPIPAIKGLAPKRNIKAWVDRKLFIHNLGHSAAAYIGHLYNPRFVYICEALSVPEVYQKVREAMLQSAAVLIKKYPDEFSSGDLGEHINDLLMRFQNKALGDTIFRCGCDLKRKLGPEDRLAGAIKLAMEFDLPYNKILYVLVCGCHFRATNENGQMLKGDAEFGNLYGKGLNGVLTTVCGFDETRDIQLFREAGSINNNSIVRSY